MDVNSDTDVSSSPSISDISGMKEVTNINDDLGINEMISDISAMSSTEMYNRMDNIEINQQKENGLLTPNRAADLANDLGILSRITNSFLLTILLIY